MKLAVAVVTLIILGGGAYAYSTMNTKTQTSTVSESVTPTQVPQAGKQMSIQGLLANGLAQKCTFDKGTFYVNGGKMRGDINAEVGGKTTVTHMVMVDKTSYVWTDEQKTGFKMAFDLENITPAPTGQPQPFDPNTLGDYRCGEWTPDATLFEIPKDVKFSEFGKMSGSGSGAGFDKAAICASLSGSDKEECLKAVSSY